MNSKFVFLGTGLLAISCFAGSLFLELPWLRTENSTSSNNKIIKTKSTPSISDYKDKAIDSHKQILQEKIVFNHVQDFPGRQLGAMSLEDIVERYEFSKLKKQQGELVVDDQTLTLLENLFRDVSNDEIEKSALKLRSAAALSLNEMEGEAANEKFLLIVNGYLNYKRSIRKIDQERNARNLKPEDVMVSEVNFEELQNSAFGDEVANQLFGKQRELFLVMDKLEHQHLATKNELSQQDIRKIELTYQKIISE